MMTMLSLSIAIFQYCFALITFFSCFTVRFCCTDGSISKVSVELYPGNKVWMCLGKSCFSNDFDVHSRVHLEFRIKIHIHI